MHLCRGCMGRGQMGRRNTLSVALSVCSCYTSVAKISLSGDVCGYLHPQKLYLKVMCKDGHYMWEFNHIILIHI